MGKNRLLTTDRQAFLDHEYKHRFSGIFKTQEQFETEMQEYIRNCIHCGSFHWLSGGKQCDCDYNREFTIKTHYDDHSQDHHDQKNPC